LILVATLDSNFENKIQKNFENTEYKNIIVNSFEETIDRLEKNKNIKLVIIDIDTIENVTSIIDYIDSKLFIPFVYVSEYKKIPSNLYNKYYYSCILKDDSEFYSSLKAAIKLFENIRISKRKYFEEKNSGILEKTGEWQAIFENDYVIMLIINPETSEIVDSNPAASKFYGWSREEMSKMRVSDINTLKEVDVKKKIALLKNKNANHFTVKHRIRNGDIKDVEVYPVFVDIKGEKLIFVIVQDITERKKYEENIKKIAYYDYLTDIPNRQSFSDQLKISTENCKSNNSKMILLEIDIDYFKNINDTFGHCVGDMVLIETSKRLQDIEIKSSQLFRKGGDEFAIIISEDLSQNKISKICDRILYQIKKPIVIEGNQIFITASIGVAIYPDDGLDNETLLKNSDMAMYRSKKNGRNVYCFFSEKINLESKIRREVESNLRQAILKRELKLYYQPKINLLKNEIIGCECLARWIKDGELYKLPSEFIPVAESSGLILDLDRYVLTEACRQIEKWESTDLKGHKISVNISGRHFKQKRIIQTARTVLKKFKIPKETIEIEITEGIFLDDIKETISTLLELKEMGFGISIDDFGTGYSSFKYISQLPINRIKIDKSFIDNIANNQTDIAITKMIISMGKLLNLNVIAEGVETKEQLHLLIENGCTEIQGFYFGKPMPIEEYEKFFEKNKDKIDLLYFEKVSKLI
jgi:diguanylate cyclase (GGDEF)-like protein/PAS domain S-box-containing protein